MKVSILTPTYNRAGMLAKLYDSIKDNLKYGVEIEWRIMDDGSTDNTKEIVEGFKQDNLFAIIYTYQENQGKMAALNNLVPDATGDYIIECDSDDYLCNNAMELVAKYCKAEENIYAYVFLKYNQNNQNMGNLFKKNGQTTTMFDLYFKQGETGEKALVFNSKIRKQFKHELENNERFVTEGRMYHKMDKQYKIKCFNKPIMICEYNPDGYSKNIIEIFKKNPHGYYEYFKEILEHDLHGILLKKRLYVYKHYILFSIISNKKNILLNANGTLNKIIISILYIPGRIMTKIKMKI